MLLIAGTWDLRASTAEVAKSTLELGSYEESVFDDQRRLVDPHDFIPGGKYRSIVKLFVRYEGQESDDERWAMGTGWLIRNDLLVTAGHCAFDWGQNEGKGLGRAIEVKAYIGYNGRASITAEEIKSGAVQLRHGTKIVTTEKWLESGMNRQNDVSFIRLNKPFTGIQPIAYQDTPLKGFQERIGVVGYPGDKVSNEEYGARMYGEFRETTWDRTKSAPHMLEYHMSTYGGQNGSPVILQRGPRLPVSIGTHVYGGSNNSASTIGKLGNPYERYIWAFEANPKEIKPLRARPGVTYINLSPLDESGPSDEENVSQSMKSLIDFGAVGNVLNKASPFLGPVGGPLAGMAGTAFDTAGKID